MPKIQYPVVRLVEECIGVCVVSTCVHDDETKNTHCIICIDRQSRRTADWRIPGCGGTMQVVYTWA